MLLEISIGCVASPIILDVSETFHTSPSIPKIDKFFI